MCGFVGFSGNYNEMDLLQSSATITHRVPDDSGHFFEKESQIGLAHRRLSIQDVSSLGHQLMITAKGNVIVYNGEVYNYKSLKRGLVDKGYHFNSTSDTEVVLKLYEEYGLKMFEMLEGIFAIAIWDPARGDLILARDGLGVKPLYLTSSPEGVVFASELKALLPLIDVTKMEVDGPSLNRYLTFIYCPGDGTPLKQIKKLHPGELLVINKGQIINRQFFYQLPLSKRSKKSSQNIQFLFFQLTPSYQTAQTLYYSTWIIHIQKLQINQYFFKMLDKTFNFIVSCVH